MNRILFVAAAGAFAAAGLIMAAPASAQPMDFSCAPCVADLNDDGVTDPIWNELTSFGPWETIFASTDPSPGGTDPQGLWEDTFDRSDGVPNDEAGAWEKAFPAE
jgi:hypothetical protein